MQWSFANLTATVQVNSMVKQQTEDLDMVAHGSKVGRLSPLMVLSH